MSQSLVPIVSRVSVCSHVRKCRRSQSGIPLFARLLQAAVLALALAAPLPLAAETTQAAIIDNANWSASDDLGRKLPTFEQTGPPKTDRCVGLFYSLWHKNLRHMPTAFNMTEFLKTRPGFMDFSAHPPGGPDYPEFYWAEPLFGYYRSADPWIIRKHLVLLADAGVDYLIFDTTNAQLYDEELTALYTGAGVDLSKDTIAYCRIGERSAHTWFVLHELLGQSSVRNYDGSWTEYGSLVGVPVQLGDAAGSAEGGAA